MSTRREVLLLFPPIHSVIFGKDWKPTDSPAPPLGLLYLASPIRNVGYKVKFIDFTVDKLRAEDYFKLLKEADYILISCLTRSIENVKQIINDASKINPDAWIICGGPYCTETGYHVEGSDLTVFGEAEHIIVEILDMVFKNQSFINFSGISYRENGRIRKNAKVHWVEDLDSIEFPAFDLSLDKDYGFLYGTKISNIASIITSRGCPYHCNYCSFRGIRYRKRSIENIMQEINLRVEGGAKYLTFHDDNFLIQRVRIMELMEKIINAKFKLKILFQGRVDLADHELFRTLKKAGVFLIVFGIESANQDILDFYNKQTTVEQSKYAVVLANKVGIITFGNFMIGAPMENIAHFENNKDFFRNIPLDFLNVHILHYVKGTPIWNDAFKKGLIREDEVVVPADERISNFPLQELTRIQADLIKSFYYNPRRILRLFKKFFVNFDAGFIFKFIRIMLNKRLLRPAEKIHDV